MTNRKLTRNIKIPSADAARCWRLWTYALVAFFILNLCIAYAIEDAPDIVHTIQGIAFLLAVEGLIGAAVVLTVRLMQHFKLVFTIHWTEPKEIRRILMRLERRDVGFMAWYWPSARTGIVYSCLMALEPLAQRASFGPDKHGISLPWALAVILFAGIGITVIPDLATLLKARFSSMTMGFDSEWMGYLKGRPGKALWRYDQITRVRFETMRTGEREFRLMVVTPREGREVAFGLSDEVNEGQIATILADKGVEVVEEV